jgi:hypothetical protein
MNTTTEKPYAQTCIGTSESGLMTVYGRNEESEMWAPICRTMSKCEAIDIATDWGDFFSRAHNPDQDPDYK